MKVIVKIEANFGNPINGFSTIDNQCSKNKLSC